MRHASMRNQTMASRNIERGMREKSPHIEQRFFGVHIIAELGARVSNRDAMLSKWHVA